MSNVLRSYSAQPTAMQSPPLYELFINDSLSRPPFLPFEIKIKLTWDLLLCLFSVLSQARWLHVELLIPTQVSKLYWVRLITRIISLCICLLIKHTRISVECHFSSHQLACFTVWKLLSDDNACVCLLKVTWCLKH